MPEPGDALLDICILRVACRCYDGAELVAPKARCLQRPMPLLLQVGHPNYSAVLGR